MKSVTAGHTQQAKTVEKPNIAEIEPVAIEHPKTVSSLSKAIKQSKIITQKPKKKASDRQVIVRNN